MSKSCNSIRIKWQSEALVGTNNTVFILLLSLEEIILFLRCTYFISLGLSTVLLYMTYARY